jgi:hypothetical protein
MHHLNLYVKAEKRKLLSLDARMKDSAFYASPGHQDLLPYKILQDY